MTSVDPCGVWLVDWEMASLMVGGKIDIDHARKLFLEVEDGSNNPKAVEFDKGRKWFLCKFLNFQSSEGLFSNAPWAKSIRKTAEKHGICLKNMMPIELLDKPLTKPLDKPFEQPYSIVQDRTSTEQVQENNSESSIISIGGMQGGNYEPNFWENFYNDFQKAYGAYGYPWKKWEVIDHLRGAVANVLGKWKEMNIQGDYRDASEFLTQCANLAQQADTNAKRDKRKAPHNWLADHNYLTNPADILPKKKSESELLREAITKAAQNIKQP